MMLLFDQNVSPRLVRLLADIYPGSQHLRNIGMGAATDPRVWDYAREHDCIIVSKDSDFQQLVARFGYPPKVVWLRCGNCSTVEIYAILRRHAAQLEAFSRDPDRGVLILS
jgi:predicted nuclease of predicted toxin-antitoxin system